MINLSNTTTDQLYRYNPITGYMYLGLKSEENPMRESRADRRKRTRT
ncbi:hypothetical protein QO206_13250 [Leeuwenhoekiella aequorea]